LTFPDAQREGLIHSAEGFLRCWQLLPASGHVSHRPEHAASCGFPPGSGSLLHLGRPWSDHPGLIRRAALRPRDASREAVMSPHISRIHNNPDAKLAATLQMK